MEQRGERSTKHVLTLINKNVMKTFKSTIETFATEAMTQEEMNFLRGGAAGEPIDLIIPPRSTSDKNG